MSPSYFVARLQAEDVVEILCGPLREGLSILIDDVKGISPRMGCYHFHTTGGGWAAGWRHVHFLKLRLPRRDDGSMEQGTMPR